MSDAQSELYELYDKEIKVNFNNLARNRYLVTIGEDSHAPVGTTTVLRVLNKPALMLWPLREAMKHMRATVGLLIANDELDSDTIERLFLEAERAYLVKSDKGKDIGTETHNVIESFLKDAQAKLPIPSKATIVLIDNLSAESTKAFQAFVEWYEAVRPEVLAVEEVVYSKKYDYAGKFDCLLKIDGQIVLCDVKTTNSSQVAPLGVYAENFLQLGAYALAYEEEKGSKFIEDLAVINCSKQGNVAFLRASDIELDKYKCIKDFVKALGLFRFMQGTEFKVKNYKVVEE